MVPFELEYQDRFEGKCVLCHTAMQVIPIKELRGVARGGNELEARFRVERAVVAEFKVNAD